MVCVTLRWREMDSNHQYRERPRRFCLARADFSVTGKSSGGDMGRSRNLDLITRYQWFESTSLQRRVCEPSVPQSRSAEPERGAGRLFENGPTGIRSGYARGRGVIIRVPSLSFASAAPRSFSSPCRTTAGNWITWRRPSSSIAPSPTSLASFSDIAGRVSWAGLRII